jgi:tetratricopeptide (TPR) repeat protein
MAEVPFRDYLNEIDALIEHGSLDHAVQHCRHILAQYPKAVAVYRLLGKTLLEQEEDRAAQDVFQRVLSVDPEDFVARVGLSIVHDRNNELEPAIWHMERAFEIAPSNALIQGELRRLYARRDGDSPERIPLTRGALARMYAAGDLNSEAITDLRQLLTEQSDRIDLQVQLAEVLWRDEQRVEAAERTQQITTTLPYCLKANLILGAILRSSGANGESDEPLQRAQAVDPENEYAQRLFSGMGPLYQQSVMVDHLALMTVDRLLETEAPPAEAEEIPEWLRGLSDVEQPLLEEPESVHAERLSPGLHMPDVANEVPDWLQGLTGEGGAAAEAEVPNWLAALTGAAAVGAAAEALSDRKPEAEEVVARPADEVVPDWITQLGQTGTLTPTEEVPPQEEEPDWLAQLREAPPAPFSEQIPPSQDTETPDWLAQLQASEPTLEAEPVVSGEPDLMPQERETLPAPFSEQIPAAQDTETPEWLAHLQAAQPVLEPETTTGEVPDWLAQLRASTGEIESKEETEVDRGVGGAAVGLAGLAAAGAALFAEHEAGAEEAEPTPEPEQPIDLAQPTGPIVAETEQPVSLGITTAPTEPEVPEEMPSADDALAFLAKLAAGKEDQLRAQAQEEADVRMAEIMGRKPAEAAPAAEERQAPIKMTVPAATVAAVAAGLAAKPTKPEEAPVETKPPEAVPEEMPSADDALAFLSRLAAGKEDQLRAQAEQEAEARMAEIMGRKPGETKAAESAPVEKPGVGLPASALGATAIAAGVAATRTEEPSVEVPEEMPSADDALAFLSRLAAGKEDQLRAQAEQEADARMAAIMGRSAPLAPAQPIETAPTLEAVIEPEAEAEPVEWPSAEETTVIAEPVAEAELPDWLRAMRPTEEVVAETPESDLPEWLRAMRPSEESSESGLSALAEEEELLYEATPAGELSDWLHTRQLVEKTLEEAEIEPEAPIIPEAEAAVSFGLTSTVAEQPVEIEEELSPQDLSAQLAALERAAEQAAGQAEVAVAGQPAVSIQTSALLPLDWWIQSAADTEEQPLAGLPEPYLSPRARAAEKEKAAASAAPSTEARPGERKLPQTGPLRQTGPLSLPQTGPLGAPEPAAVPAEVEALLSRVYQNDQDYAARLDLARTYWATGNREGAYTEYLSLVNAGQYTKETMADLETVVEVHDQTDWHRMLGDVYMKVGRLSSALAQYRRALSEV